MGLFNKLKTIIKKEKTEEPQAYEDSDSEDEYYHRNSQDEEESIFEASNTYNSNTLIQEEDSSEFTVVLHYEVENNITESIIDDKEGDYLKKENKWKPGLTQSLSSSSKPVKKGMSKTQKTNEKQNSSANNNSNDNAVKPSELITLPLTARSIQLSEKLSSDIRNDNDVDGNHKNTSQFNGSKFIKNQISALFPEDSTIITDITSVSRRGIPSQQELLPPQAISSNPQIFAAERIDKHNQEKETSKLSNKLTDSFLDDGASYIYAPTDLFTQDKDHANFLGGNTQLVIRKEEPEIPTYSSSLMSSSQKSSTKTQAWNSENLAGTSVLDRISKATDSMFTKKEGSDLPILLSGTILDTTIKEKQKHEKKALNFPDYTSLPQGTIAPVQDLFTTDIERPLDFGLYKAVLDFPNAFQNLEVRVTAIAFRSWDSSSLKIWNDLFSLITTDKKEDLQKTINKLKDEGQGISIGILDPFDRFVSTWYTLYEASKTHSPNKMKSLFGGSKYRIQLPIDRSIFIPLEQPIAGSGNVTVPIDLDLLLQTSYNEALAAARFQVPVTLKDGFWHLATSEFIKSDSSKASPGTAANIHQVDLYRADQVLPIKAESPEKSKLLEDLCIVGKVSLRFMQITKPKREPKPSNYNKSQMYKIHNATENIGTKNVNDLLSSYNFELSENKLSLSPTKVNFANSSSNLNFTKTEEKNPRFDYKKLDESGKSHKTDISKPELLLRVSEKLGTSSKNDYTYNIGHSEKTESSGLILSSKILEQTDNSKLEYTEDAESNKLGSSSKFFQNNDNSKFRYSSKMDNSNIGQKEKSLSLNLGHMDRTDSSRLGYSERTDTLKLDSYSKVPEKIDNYNSELSEQLNTPKIGTSSKLIQNTKNPQLTYIEKLEGKNLGYTEASANPKLNQSPIFNKSRSETSSKSDEKTLNPFMSCPRKSESADISELNETYHSENHSERGYKNYWEKSSKPKSDLYKYIKKSYEHEDQTANQVALFESKFIANDSPNVENMRSNVLSPTLKSHKLSADSIFFANEPNISNYSQQELDPRRPFLTTSSSGGTFFSLGQTVSNNSTGPRAPTIIENNKNEQLNKSRSTSNYKEKQ